MDFNHTIDFGLFFGCALRQFDGQYTIADVGTDMCRLVNRVLNLRLKTRANPFMMTGINRYFIFLRR